jgi:hypothetical protein
MLAPDGSSGDVPVANLNAARQAGFKVAAIMQSPDGQVGYIPAERTQDAVAKGFKMVPTQDFQNDQQEGFWESLGHSFGIGQEEGEARAQQAQQHPVSTMIRAMIPGADAVQGVVQGAKRIASELSQIPGAFKAGNPAEAGVHAVQAIPILGPAIQHGAEQLNPGQSVNPAEMGTALGGAIQGGVAALGGADEAFPERPMLPTPNLVRMLPGGSLPSAAAKIFPSLFDPTEPTDLMTRAVKPGKNNVGWNNDVKQALPLMKSAEAQLGHPVTGIDDALDAVTAAKKNIWSQYQQRLGPASQMGATIDGNQIADAMMQSIDRRTAIQNPGLAQRVQQVADTYRRPMSLDEAEDFLQSANKDLNTYYAKNKASRRVAMNDPEVSSTVAESDALRDGLYGKMDTLFGPGAAQLKQAYGSLMNMEKELNGRQLVASRQNPDSLAEQVSTARGAGKIIKGLTPIPGIFDPGAAIEGAQNIAVARGLKARNTSDAMIERAFAKAQPAQPFPAPVSPRLAGLLQRGPIQIPGNDASGAVSFTPPPVGVGTTAERLGRLLPAQSGGQIIPPEQVGNVPYSPQMSPGEQVSALMHMLRQMQPKGLPAKASAIQLPPPQ